ncbi:MAG: YncE family protein [Planctomycetota bacterium]
MRRIDCILAGMITALVGTVVAAEPRAPGPQPDGSVLLPTQWSLRPAGRQVTVGDFPVNIAVHPDGRHAVVLHCGYGRHELAVLDLTTRSLVSRTVVPEAFYGLAIDAAGRRCFVSGAGDELVRRYRLESAAIVPDGELLLRDKNLRGVPAGVAVSSDGGTLYVANLWGQSVSRVNLEAGATGGGDLPLTAEPLPASCCCGRRDCPSEPSSVSGRGFPAACRGARCP